MIKPTREFLPFGERGPKVVLFGKQTGDWSMNGLSPYNVSGSGLYFRLNQLGQKFGFRDLLVPSPVDFNAKICTLDDFPVIIQKGAGSLAVYRGYKADGIVLRHNQVGAIPTADCPTIVVYRPAFGQAVMAHAGFGSLVDIDHLLHNKSPRQYFSVVDAIVERVRLFGLHSIQVFITCGIREYQRRDFAAPLRQLYPQTRALDGDYINMQVLIKEQFATYGIDHVTVDLLDTFGDKNKEGEPLWNSFRRDHTTARNLVMVANNSIL